MTHQTIELNETLIGIIIYLHVIFAEQHKILKWLNTENRLFKGETPMDLIVKGKGNLVLITTSTAIITSGDRLDERVIS